MTEQSPYSPEPEQSQEPVMIGELLENADELLTQPPDEARAHDVRLRDLEHERQSVQEAIDEMWQEIQSGRVPEEKGIAEIESLKRDMLAIDVERFEIRDKKQGSQ